MKTKTISVFLLVFLVLSISLYTLSESRPKVEERVCRVESIIRPGAKGGVPGPPSDKPKPPDDDPPVIEYELFIEIDYLDGYAPTGSVLTYIIGYYSERGIVVTFLVSEQAIPMKQEYENGISSSEFWALEEAYNDVLQQDDRASDEYDADGDGYYEEFFLKEKWILYGTTVEGEPYTVGYAFCVFSLANPRKADLLAGNYIFIASEGAQEWAEDNSIDPRGAEAVVLMHELGHSIGIAVIEWDPFYGFTETYDRDTFSVMSYLNENNAGYYDKWYYSNKYWKTRNMEYYEKNP